MINMFRYSKNHIKRAYNNPIFVILPIYRADIDSRGIIGKVASWNNFIGGFIFAGNFFAKIICAKSLVICNTIYIDVLVCLVTNRIFKDYILYFCHYNTPFGSALCFSLFSHIDLKASLNASK